MAKPFHTYIWKIFSRCNLNCTYCYMYNLADQRFLSQPKRMSERTIVQSCRRIREHLDRHGKSTALFILHGGEPLLGGAAALDEFFSIVDRELPPDLYKIKRGMQTNGVLLDAARAQACLRHRVSVGISLDGPPDVNDRHRKDLAGKGSSTRVERGIRLLQKPEFSKIFAGFLVVVDIESDPLACYRYLSQFAPRSIDFLLPHDNHDRKPNGNPGPGHTPYAQWLLAIFDEWWDSKSPIRVREFDNIIRMLFGGRSNVEALGTEPVDLIVVETNGAIEGVDALKSVYEGATDIGLNVFTNTFDDALDHAAVSMRQLGADALCDTCQACRLVGVCGGGYLPHRYGKGRGFLNPSVYCHDLQLLIDHIAYRLGETKYAGLLRKIHQSNLTA